MSRGTLLSLLLSLVVMATGCRMCSSPYDDCSPTFTGQCGEDCAPMARAGSVLSGYFPGTVGGQFPPDQVPNLPELPDDQSLLPEVGSSGANGPPMAEDKPLIDRLPEMAAPEQVPQVDEAQPLSSDGWSPVKRTDLRLP